MTQRKRENFEGEDEIHEIGKTKILNSRRRVRGVVIQENDSLK